MDERYKKYLTIVKYINDPVYGQIGLTEAETKLVDTRAFQRLRSLRQLARVNYVFPGTEHSRFVHSLGVLHNMSLMTEHLHEIGDFDYEDVFKLRISAILHDIGHYPLSHLGEAAYSYLLEIDRAHISIEDDASPEDDDAFSKVYKMASSHSKAAHHESLGQVVVQNNSEISKILSLYDLDPNEIGGIFRGVRGSANYVYTQLIHSNLDADRLDYLLRDSFQSGLKYGMVDLGYLINLLGVKKSNLIPTGDEEDETNLLVFNAKGKHVIEHFLMARYFHYTQFVLHKTGTAFEGMIKAMYIKLIRSGDTKFMFKSLDDIHGHIDDERFYTFTDSFLEYELYDYNEKTDDEDFKILYNCYVKRIRPKTLFEYKDRHGNQEEPKLTLFKNILENRPDEISHIMGTDLWGYTIAGPSIEQMPNPVINPNEIDEDMIEKMVEAIKIFDENGNISFLAEDPSMTIKDLISKKVEFVRVYCMDPDKESEYSSIRKKLKELFEGR